MHRTRSRAVGPGQALVGIFLLFWLSVSILFVLTPSDNLGRNALSSRRMLQNNSSETSEVAKPPLKLNETINYLEGWISQLHSHLLDLPHPADAETIWAAFHDLTRTTLYPWDVEYLTRMPERRHDGSIFLSVASYRDEHCPDTLQQAYVMAKHPELLVVGLVQQNCYKDCQTGVLEDGMTHPVAPDLDCYESFCQTEVGRPHCDAGHVRVLRMEEPDSLGPYMARYLASKLWYGEEWYMQIDAHMTFAQDWDKISLESLAKAPSEKPVSQRWGRTDVLHGAHPLTIDNDIISGLPSSLG
jgi:Glycosyltransferase (GlcNAc)